MKFLNDIKLRTIGWAFTATLVLAGGSLAAGSIIIVRKVAVIQTTWSAFQARGSEKARSLNEIRATLGYGGMIHHFKNLVLRRDAALIQKVQEGLGAANAAVNRYSSLVLNMAESEALLAIGEVLKNYDRALTTAGRLLNEGKSASEIDQAVRINDDEALHALSVLDEGITAEIGAGEITKVHTISELRAAIGYGGVIHHFKNYILRKGLVHRDLMREGLLVANKAVSQYLALGVNRVENEALRDVTRTLDAYDQALTVAERLSNEGKLAWEIDRSVKVDDVTAFKAFVTLNQQVNTQIEIASREVNDALALVAGLTKTGAWVDISVILLLIAASFWLIRKRIIDPIGELTTVMTRLAEDDLDIDIEGAGQMNEIGEMARAV